MCTCLVSVFIIVSVISSWVAFITTLTSATVVSGCSILISITFHIHINTHILQINCCTRHSHSRGPHHLSSSCGHAHGPQMHPSGSMGWLAACSKRIGTIQRLSIHGCHGVPGVLWMGEGNEAHNLGSLSLPGLDDKHLRHWPEALDVIFQSLLIGVEVNPFMEGLPQRTRQWIRVLEFK